MIEEAAIGLKVYEQEYAAATVRMWRTSKQKALGIDEHHSFADRLRYLNGVLAEENSIVLAMREPGDTVAGFIASDGIFVNQLYIHVDFQRQGIGSRLLDFARARSSGSLRLYTFAANRGARALYAKHGFQIVGRGSDNEERLPHLLLEWHNRDSAVGRPAHSEGPRRRFCRVGRQDVMPRVPRMAQRDTMDCLDL